MDDSLKYRTQLQARFPNQIRDLFLVYQIKIRSPYYRMKKHRYKEKPKGLSQQYKNYRMLIRLCQWKLTNEAKSMMEAEYSSHPRNPE